MGAADVMTMNDTYKRTAAEAQKILRDGGAVPTTTDEALSVAFVICVARLLSNDTRTISLSTALEYLDVRQHTALTPHEFASLLATLASAGLVTLAEGNISFTAAAWQALPRTKTGALAFAAKDGPRWRVLLRA